MLTFFGYVGDYVRFLEMFYYTAISSARLSDKGGATIERVQGL